jgi:hypothetical protein
MANAAVNAKAQKPRRKGNEFRNEVLEEWKVKSGRCVFFVGLVFGALATGEVP